MTWQDNKDSEDALPVPRGTQRSALELAEKQRARFTVPVVEGEGGLHQHPQMQEVLARKRLAIPLWAGAGVAGVVMFATGVSAWPLVLPSLLFAGVGFTFVVGGITNAYKRWRGQRALLHTLKQGVTLPATVTQHGTRGSWMKHQAHNLRAVVTVESEYDGESIEHVFETANPELTHPIGAEIRIVYNPDTGNVFVPDEEGLRLELPKALPVEEVPEEEEPGEPDEREIFGAAPSLTEAYPVPRLIDGGWSERIGKQKVEVADSLVQVTDGNGDPVATFNLEQDLAVNMSQTGDDHVLVSVRQRNSGWERWHFLLAGADWESITGEGAERLMRQHRPPDAGVMGSRAAHVLLAHIAAFKEG